jgi:hypothetical protein
MDIFDLSNEFLKISQQLTIKDVDVDEDYHKINVDELERPIIKNDPQYHLSNRNQDTFDFISEEEKEIINNDVAKHVFDRSFELPPPSIFPQMDEKNIHLFFNVIERYQDKYDEIKEKYNEIIKKIKEISLTNSGKELNEQSSLELNKLVEESEFYNKKLEELYDQIQDSQFTYKEALDTYNDLRSAYTEFYNNYLYFLKFYNINTKSQKYQDEFMKLPLKEALDFLPTLLEAETIRVLSYGFLSNTVKRIISLLNKLNDKSLSWLPSELITSLKDYNESAYRIKEKINSFDDVKKDFYKVIKSNQYAILISHEETEEDYKRNILNKLNESINLHFNKEDNGFGLFNYLIDNIRLEITNPEVSNLKYINLGDTLMKPFGSDYYKKINKTQTELKDFIKETNDEILNDLKSTIEKIGSYNMIFNYRSNLNESSLNKINEHFSKYLNVLNEGEYSFIFLNVLNKILKLNQIGFLGQKDKQKSSLLIKDVFFHYISSLHLEDFPLVFFQNEIEDYIKNNNIKYFEDKIKNKICEEYERIITRAVFNGVDNERFIFDNPDKIGQVGKINNKYYGTITPKDLAKKFKFAPEDISIKFILLLSQKDKLSKVSSKWNFYSLYNLSYNIFKKLNTNDINVLYNIFIKLEKFEDEVESTFSSSDNFSFDIIADYLLKYINKPENELKGAINKISTMSSLIHNNGANIDEKEIKNLIDNKVFQDTKTVAYKLLSESILKIKNFGGKESFLKNNEKSISLLKSKNAISQSLSEDIDFFEKAFNDIKEASKINKDKESFVKLRKFKKDIDMIVNFNSFKKYYNIASKPENKKIPELFKLNDQINPYLRFVVLEDLDYDYFNVGAETNCCQTIGGAGEYALVDSFINPEAGVVVLEYNDGSCWQLVSQSYFHYVPKDNSYILDNVEAVPKFQDGIELPPDNGIVYSLDDIYSYWAKKKSKELNLKYFHSGKSYSKIDKENFESAELEEDPRNFKSSEKYTDYSNRNSIDLLNPKFEQKDLSKIAGYINYLSKIAAKIENNLKEYLKNNPKEYLSMEEIDSKSFEKYDDYDYAQGAEDIKDDFLQVGSNGVGLLDDNGKILGYIYGYKMTPDEFPMYLDENTKNEELSQLDFKFIKQVPEFFYKDMVSNVKSGNVFYISNLALPTNKTRLPEMLNALVNNLKTQGYKYIGMDALSDSMRLFMDKEFNPKIKRIENFGVDLIGISTEDENHIKAIFEIK